MSGKLTRKGLQVHLDTHAKIMELVAEKQKRLAVAGHPREVTADEVIREKLGLK